MNAGPSREVSRETQKRRRRANGTCRCGDEPVIPGQNYGHKCHAANMKKWRAKERQRIEAERAELKRLREIERKAKQKAESMHV